MKKTLMVAVVLALVLAAAIPAMAQERNRHNDRDLDNGGVIQEIGQESESGDVAIEFSTSSSGDYAQQCVAPLQFGNTGNLQNAQGFLQYDSVADDLEGNGSTFEFAPAIETTCDQAVQQSSAASS